MKRTPDLSVCYDNLDSCVKHIVKQALIREQRGLCAYCMSRISGDGCKGSSIEHYIPQHGEDGADHMEESLDYGNMLAVCVTSGSHQRCDKSRGNKALTVNPLDERTLEGISYKRDGTIRSKDPAVDRDLCITLNLNDNEVYLKDNRKSAMGAVDKFVNRMTSGATGDANRMRWRNECVRRKEAYLNEEEYRPYLGAILFRLDHYIRKFSS